MIIHTVCLSTVLTSIFLAHSLTLPRLEKVDRFHAVVCNTNDKPECLCSTPPTAGCDVCCTTGETEVECTASCASGASINASNYEVAARKVVDAFHEVETNSSIPSSTTSNATSVILPVTWVENEGN